MIKDDSDKMIFSERHWDLATGIDAKVLFSKNIV
jgi:hypothetical protein